MVNTLDLQSTPVTNGHKEGDKGHQAAINAADEYFKNLTLSDNSGNDLSSPTAGVLPNMGYLVNQNAPDQVYRPGGGSNGDLLL